MSQQICQRMKAKRGFSLGEVENNARTMQAEEDDKSRKTDRKGLIWEFFECLLFSH